MLYRMAAVTRGADLFGTDQVSVASGGLTPHAPKLGLKWENVLSSSISLIF